MTRSTIRRRTALVAARLGAVAFGAAMVAAPRGAAGQDAGKAAPPAASPHSAASGNPHGPAIGACATCHVPAAWKPAKVAADFRHAAAFPLDGAHLHTACTACHRSLDFAHTASACGSCHTDVHRGEVGTDCARCHTTRSFVDVERMRRIHELTRFPLRGAHAAAACEQCHIAAQPGQAQYVSRPSTCVACHLGNYRDAKSPDHQASQFPTDCAACHGMNTWSGAGFDHAMTRFPLTGAHRSVSCDACHGDHVYAGKPTACASCHLANYNGTTNPSHAAAGFPQTCESCHTTTTWTGATFDHDGAFFPIYSGAHGGRWTTCAQCHTSPSNFAVFTCTSCHTQSQTDPHHTGVPNYVFNSANCYACHPRGRAG